MDLLDRLLGHDRWTTLQLLERYHELQAEQWRQPFDLGHQTLEATFRHMVDNVRVWTDLVAERAVQQSSDQAVITLEDLITQWQVAYETLPPWRAASPPKATGTPHMLMSWMTRHATRASAGRSHTSSPTICTIALN